MKTIVIPRTSILADNGHELNSDRVKSLMYENTCVPSVAMSEIYEEKPDSIRLFII